MRAWQQFWLAGWDEATTPVVVPVASGGGGGGVVRYHQPHPSAPPPVALPQYITGYGSVTQPAPTFAGTGHVGPSLEEQWILGLISDEELLLGKVIRDPAERWALGLLTDEEFLLAS